MSEFFIPNQHANNINNVNGTQINYHEYIISIDPLEMAGLIDSFFNHVDGFIEAVQDTSRLKRIKIEDKNELNGMSNDYYESSIKEYMVHFLQVDDFLGDPLNNKHKRRYTYISREINSKLTAYKKRFPNFDEAIENLTSNYIDKINRDFEKKGLVRIFIAYMYYMCDIGKNKKIEGEV